MAEQGFSGEAGQRARIRDATGRLLATADGLTDELARQPSLLPGWSRGHVLTHLARNADGLRNLLAWARTGIETPQYASQQARDQDIEDGAGRTAAELAADVRDSAARFDAAARSLSPDQWQATVRGLRGPPHKAAHTLWRRLSEVEFHHVDLDAGYGPGDWPAEFVAWQLRAVAADFAEREECPAAVLQDGAGREYRIGAALAGDPGPVMTITGPGSELLAWLIGRSAGSGLGRVPAAPLPAVPPL